MTPNYPLWQIVFNIVQLALTFAVWWTSRNKVTNDRFTQLENSKIQLELEVKHIRQDIQKQRPACDNHGRMEDNDKILFKRIESMHGDIKTITGSVGKIEGGLDGIKHLSTLINQFLIEQGGKK